MNPEPRDVSNGDLPLLPAVVLFVAFAFVLMLVLANAGVTRTAEEAAALQPTLVPTQVALEPTAQPTLEPTVEEPASQAVAFDPEVVAAGEAIYQTTCTACHGMDAQGVPGLGKGLVDSDFIHGLTDEQLVEFIASGRPAFDPANTTGVEMPARGGNPSLTDEQLGQVVVYLRSLAVEAGVPAAPEGEVSVAAQGDAEATAAPDAAAVVPTDTAAGQSETGEQAFVSPGAAVGEGAAAEVVREELTGEEAYIWYCSVCHGRSGEGAPYLGPAITDSELVANEDTSALVAFLRDGRPLANPQAEFPHPARGGYPPMTDGEIDALVAYLFATFE